MPSTVRPYERPKIKNPADDPVIAMAHDRRKKELANAKNVRLCSEAGGVIRKKDLELKDLNTEIRAVADGVREYEDNMKLLRQERVGLEKKIKEHQEWCDTFNKSIGPFEEKYEQSLKVVKESYDFAKMKYEASLQRLIDDFGFHPAFKRWFDEF